MNQNQNDNLKTEVVEATALESIERASIDMQITTAKKYPMHSPNMLSKVKEDMLTLATLDEETAAGCFYSLPRGNKTIQGPSVRLAEIALNCYGNIRIGARIIEVNSDVSPHVVVQSVCHDLENNALITIEKRRRIVKKKNKPSIDEDDIQLAVNACTSIAYRDAAFKLIPMAIIKPVWLAAKKLAIGDIKSLTAKRGMVIERLKRMGVREENILAVVSCRKIEDIGVEHLGVLIGLGTALKDGETTLEEAFPPIIPSNSKLGTEGLKDRIKNQNGNGKDTLAQAERETAEMNAKADEQERAETQAKVAEQKKKLEETEAAKQTERNPLAKEFEEEVINKESEQLQGFCWQCNKCGHQFDVPKTGANQVPLCPKCLTKDIKQTAD